MLTLAVIAKHNAKSFRKLVDSAIGHVFEIVVAVDDDASDGIYGYMPSMVKYLRRPLANDFAAQRNFTIENSTEPWVLSLDTDENLGAWMWNNITSIISESKADVILLPRANYIEGQSKSNDDFIGWPDWQPKLHSRNVRWQFPVHEWPIGELLYQRLPEELKYAILHNKTIEDQAKANTLYERIKQCTT